MRNPHEPHNLTPFSVYRPVTHSVAQGIHDLLQSTQIMGRWQLRQPDDMRLDYLRYTTVQSALDCVPHVYSLDRGEVYALLEGAMPRLSYLVPQSIGVCGVGQRVIMAPTPYVSMHVTLVGKGKEHARLNTERQAIAESIGKVVACDGVPPPKITTSRFKIDVATIEGERLSVRLERKLGSALRKCVMDYGEPWLDPMVFDDTRPSYESS
jgi:hypothetical protein